ncbi:predicted protein, partial [Nematostella vectensis]
SVDVTGRTLLFCFLKALLKRNDFVCFVAFELPPDVYMDIVDSQSRSRIIIVDNNSDPLGWISATASLQANNAGVVNAVMTEIKEKCSSFTEAPPKVSIVFDCLSKLVLNSPTCTCQILNQLTRSQAQYQVGQIVGLIHADLHEKEVLNAVSSICSSVLEVFENDSGEKETYCKILHIKKTGKVLKKRQTYTIGDDYVLAESREEDWTTPKAAQQEITSEKPVDPTSNLTFNLKLTDAEEKARANIQLPFMHNSTSLLVSSGNNAQESSQIFYQPDAADDFDEDDPDDDLDI